MNKILNYFFCAALLCLTVACGRSGQLTLPETGIPTPSSVETPVVVTEEAPELVASPSPVPEAEANQHLPIHAVAEPKAAVTSTLELAHQKYAEQFGLELQMVKDSWQNNMGVLQAGSIEETADFNKFFQFVRETGGTAFTVNNNAAASFNSTAHEYLKAAIDNNDGASVDAVNVNLAFQIESAEWIQQRIVDVAGIYGVHVAKPLTTSIGFNLVAKNFADPVGDRLNANLPSSNANTQVIKDCRAYLKSLLTVSSLQVNAQEIHNNAGKYVSFLSFDLLEKNSDGQYPLIVDGRFQVNDRLYGAVEVLGLFFVEN